MRQVCAQPADQIKQQVAKVAKAVFYVVAKDIQEPHVRDNVPPRCMQKHGAYKWHQSVAGGQSSAEPGFYIARDEGEMKLKSAQSARAARELELPLKEEDHKIK